MNGGGDGGGDGDTDGGGGESPTGPSPGHGSSIDPQNVRAIPASSLTTTSTNPTVSGSHAANDAGSSSIVANRTY